MDSVEVHHHQPFLGPERTATSDDNRLQARAQSETPEKGLMPYSLIWLKVNQQEVPINAVWMSAFISFCMGLTSLGSLVVSIATIGLYISYALPIFFRVTLARSSLIPGPFTLGRYGILGGWSVVIWVITISVLFSLPVAYLIKAETLNYTPVAVGGLLLLKVSSWILRARHWFKGPVTNIHV